MSKKHTPARTRPETPTKRGLVRGRRLMFDPDEDEVATAPAPPSAKKPEPRKVKRGTPTEKLNPAIIKKIKAEFYDPKSGLWSFDKIQRKLKAKGINVKPSDVKAVLDTQLVTQVYKPPPLKNKERFLTIIAKGPRDQYQADLLDLKAYTKFNKGNRYLWNVIDVYSRFAFSLPLKSKKEEDVIDAMEQTLKVMGKPTNLNTDLESAILGKKFQNVLKEQGIKHWQHNPNDDKKNMSIVERFNRTIRDVLVKYFYTRDTKNWLDILPDLLNNYNSTYHSTIKQNPIDVWKKIKVNSQTQKNAPPFTIKVGDTVRILKRYAQFTKKSDVKKFTKNEYKVVEIDGNNFVVKNEKGVIQRRKEYELQKIDPETLEAPDFKPEGKEGEGKAFKVEKQKAKAERRFRKEDLKSDLVQTQPTKEKRERKQPVRYK